MVEVIGVFLNIESFLDISLVEITMDDCVFHTSQLKMLPAGMDQLPRSMLKEMGPYIKYEAKVSRVEQKEMNRGGTREREFTVR